VERRAREKPRLVEYGGALIEYPNGSVDSGRTLIASISIIYDLF
jgi:hypothetical protein